MRQSSGIKYYKPALDRMIDFITEQIHADYGPCDGIADGNCSVCIERIAILKADKAIRLWRFYDAPESLRKLSTHGGDEDWLIYAPGGSDSENCHWPFPIEFALSGHEDSYVHGFGHVDKHELPDGAIVIIFAHA